jgi:hypothetical protein
LEAADGRRDGLQLAAMASRIDPCQEGKLSHSVRPIEKRAQVSPYLVKLELRPVWPNGKKEQGCFMVAGGGKTGHREQGKPPLRWSVNGAVEVGWIDPKIEERGVPQFVGGNLHLTLHVHNV